MMMLLPGRSIPGENNLNRKAQKMGYPFVCQSILTCELVGYAEF
jgi:hypothetical protein